MQPEFLTVRQSWTPKSRLTRIKLFGECCGEKDWTIPLRLDSDGFLDISSGNGFFFAGFLELETLFERPFTWAAAREPATYNSSEPAPTVPDLRYWLGLAEQHQ
jgi:hypothetical protein